MPEETLIHNPGQKKKIKDPRYRSENDLLLGEHLASFTPAVLDTANVISQNYMINKIEDERSKAKLVPTPEINLAVRTPHGLTSEQRAAAENKLLSSGGGAYKGSDFAKMLLTNNLRNLQIQSGLDQLAAKDAALYRESYNMSFDDENKSRLARHSTSMENSKRAQELTDYKLKVKVDALSDKRGLMADVFDGMRKTIDSDAQFTATNLEANRQAKIRSLQSQIDHASYMASTAADAAAKLMWEQAMEDFQGQLDTEFNTPLPSRRNLVGVSLVPRSY